MNFNSLINDNSHDWLTFTLTQESDDMWNLVVTDVAGNTVYSSATDKNVAGGLLNGARNDNSNYVDNALNTILFGNPNGFKPLGDLYRDLDVYVTEIRAEAKPVAVSGENILSSIYAMSATVPGEATLKVNKSSMAVPEGFTSVGEINSGFSGPHGSYGNTYIHGRMNHDDISQFAEVHFALKSTAKFRLDNGNGVINQHYDDWLYFYLTKAKKGWDVKVVCQNKVIATFSNEGTTICNVLWHQAAGTTPYADKGESLTVYATEVRATRQTELAKVGDVIDQKLYNGDKTEITETNEVAPSGYDYVWQTIGDKTAMGSIYYLHGGKLSATSIADYDEVNFAVMTKCKFGTSKVQYDAYGWVYVTMTRNGDNWDLVAKLNGSVFWTKSGANYGGDDNYPANSLAAANFNVWWLPFTETKDAPVYFTELRGTKKA